MIRPATIFFYLVIASLLVPIVAAAQDVVHDNADLEVCQTNSGVAGALFVGLFGTLEGPEGFASVAVAPSDGTEYDNLTSSNEDITLFADIRFERQILAFAAAGADEPTRVEFRDDLGGVLQSCLISFATFDPSLHDFSQTSVGFCEFVDQGDILELEVGVAEIFELPEKYREGVTSPRSVLDHRPEVGAMQVKLTGGTAGYAIFAWLGDDAGNGMLKGLCPVVVSGGS